MELIDIIKENSRKIALVFGLGSSLTGCVGLEPGPLNSSKLLFGGTVFDSENSQYSNNRSVDNASVKSESRVKYFLCSEVRDIDNNGKSDYPYDFKGIKNAEDFHEFSPTDNIIFVAYDLTIPRKKAFSYKDGNKIVLNMGGAPAEIDFSERKHDC